jgi:predicted Zn-dependent protease
MPGIADRVGKSAIERLALPTGIADDADGALAVIAERLRPATATSTRSFRLVLAGYSEAHSFGIPAGTVVVTAGLVCSAKDPEFLTTVVARELAHLENHDVSKRVAEAVDFRTVLELARGDMSTLRARMLDFADPARFPGFPEAQETAAEQRAKAILAATATPRDANQDKDGVERIPKDLAWSKVRAETCELIGR